MKTYPLYLNGRFVASEPTRPVVNPATAEPFALVSTTATAAVPSGLA